MTRLRLSSLALLPMLAAPVAAQTPATYDEGWFRADHWSGEWPSGVGIIAETSVEGRAEPSPDAPREIACTLPARAVYHPWNAERSEADNVDFVSFTQKRSWEVTGEGAYAIAQADGAEVPLPPGTQWTYLLYYAEGIYEIEVDGVTYDADQSLFEASREREPGGEGYDEWFGLDCLNGARAWLYLPDLAIDDVRFAPPNIVEYGRAADLD